MEAPLQKRANAPIAFSTLVAILLAVAIVVWAGSLVPRFAVGPTLAYGVSVQEAAWYACTAHIALQYNYSFLDAQRYYPANVTNLSRDTYRARIGYASEGRTVLCTIQRTSAGGWQLVQLQ